MLIWSVLAADAFALLIAANISADAQVPGGAGRLSIALGETRLDLFTYRPACRDPSLLLVFHGQNHNADDYRNWARPLGDKHCMLVVAPRFGKTQFPRWRYQHGGIANNGKVQDRQEWVGRLVLDIVKYMRQLEGRQMPYSMIGHSAGGQFLSRLAAFTPTEAQRIIIANPGTHVLPDAQVQAPYGFAGVYTTAAVEKELRRYVEAPITIFLGDEDTEEEGLNTSAEARAQGATRQERGHRTFKAARELAQARGWSFGWRLIEVAGVGHSARKMFASPEADAALKP